CGGYKMLPLIISWPRGSNMSPFLIQSYSFKKCCLFSLMFFPCKTGPPPATRRTGLPHVCASIQKNVFFIFSLCSLFILPHLSIHCPPFSIYAADCCF